MLVAPDAVGCRTASIVEPHRLATASALASKAEVGPGTGILLSGSVRVGADPPGSATQDMLRMEERPALVGIPLAVRASLTADREAVLLAGTLTGEVAP